MRVAVIGCGSIGQRHIANLLVLNDADPSGDILIYDQDAERTWRAGIDPVRIRALASPDDLWARQPDAVLICTPPETHGELAHNAYWAGVRGIFVEKPLSNREWFQGALAKFGLRTTLVGANWRWHPGPDAIKAWLREDAIGKPLHARFQAGYYLPSIRADYATSYVATTGATLDIGAHMVDLATWLLGPAELVSAATVNAASIGLPDIDGACEMVLRHESGAASSVGVSMVQRHRTMGIEIAGSQQRISWDGESARLYGPTVDSCSCTWAAFASYPSVDGDYDKMYCSQLRHFLAELAAAKGADRGYDAFVAALAAAVELGFPAQILIFIIALALSFGMLGCDYHCGYCQNWVTSQALRDPRAVAPPRDVEPADIVRLALLGYYRSKNNPPDACKFAGILELREHAIQNVNLFACLFDEENRILCI